MQDASADNTLAQAEREKEAQETSLKERLARRQKEREQAVKEETTTYQKQLEEEDVITQYN